MTETSSQHLIEPRQENAEAFRLTRRSLVVGGLLLSCLRPSMVKAAPLDMDVVFAGVTLLGEHADLKFILPLTLSLLSKETAIGQRQVDKAFRKALKEHPPTNLRLVVDQVASPEDAFVLAAALYFEDMGSFVSSAHGGDAIHYVFSELYGQAMLVDMSEMMIVQSYPFRIANPGLQVEGTLTQARKEEIFYDFILGENWIKGDPFGVVFAKKIQNLEFKERLDPLFMQVGEVNLEDRAIKTLNELDVDPKRYRKMLGYTLSASLSDKLQMPILPYRIDKTIGGALPTQFMNVEEVQGIKIPEANFLVDITLRGFKRKVLAESKIQERFVAGVYVRITVQDLREEKVIFDQKMRVQTRKPRVVLKKFRNEWKYYKDLMILACDRFAIAAGEPNSENLNLVGIRKPEKVSTALEQFLELSKAIAKCR